MKFCVSIRGNKYVLMGDGAIVYLSLFIPQGRFIIRKTCKKYKEMISLKELRVIYKSIKEEDLEEIETYLRGGV